VEEGAVTTNSPSSHVSHAVQLVAFTVALNVLAPHDVQLRSTVALAAAPLTCSPSAQLLHSSHGLAELAS
jgi:hypothetical protein